MSASGDWRSRWKGGKGGRQDGSAWTGGGDANRLNPAGHPNSTPDASSSTQQWSSSSSHWTSGREAQQQTYASSGGQQWDWSQQQSDGPGWGSSSQDQRSWYDSEDWSSHTDQQAASSGSRQGEGKTNWHRRPRQQPIPRNPPTDRYSGLPLMYEKNNGPGHPWFAMPEFAQRLPQAGLPNVHQVLNHIDYRGQYVRNGNLRAPKNINVSIRSQDVFEYARKFECVQWQADVGLPEMFVPRSSISHFFLECRHAGSYSDSCFMWPSNKLMYQKTLSTAAQIMPPGYMVSIPNGTPIPDEFGSTPDCLFHGTWASNVPLIIRQGFKPSHGTGSFTLGAWHLGSLHEESKGLPSIEFLNDEYVVRPAAAVPLVRLTKDFQEACNHPNVRETQDFPPATVLATDGTLPMTAVFRVVTRPNRDLWRSFGEHM